MPLVASEGDGPQAQIKPGVQDQRRHGRRAGEADSHGASADVCEERLRDRRRRGHPEERLGVRQH